MLDGLALMWDNKVVFISIGGRLKHRRRPHPIGGNDSHEALQTNRKEKGSPLYCNKTAHGGGKLFLSAALAATLLTETGMARQAADIPVPDDAQFKILQTTVTQKKPNSEETFDVTFTSGLSIKVGNKTYTLNNYGLELEGIEENGQTIGQNILFHSLTQNGDGDWQYSDFMHLIDYRLVNGNTTLGQDTNKNNIEGYKVGTNGIVELTVEDPYGKQTSTVNIGGIAVVYDDNNNMVSTNGAKAEDTNGNSIALGKNALASNGDSIALGTNAHSGKKGIAIGVNANASNLGSAAREGAITIGSDSGTMGLYSTVVGTNSVIKSDGTTYKALNGFADTKKNAQGAMSTMTGAFNTMNNSTYGDSGVANSITGSVNTVTNSNGVVIQGTGNTVTNAYNKMDFSFDELMKLYQGGTTEEFIKTLASKDSGAVAVIGGANTISDTTYTTDIGFGNTIANSKDVFTSGSRNKLTNIKNSVVLGNDITMSGVESVVSLGNDNKVTASKAVALGDGAKVSQEGGVALGVGSNASVAEGAVGYLADGATDATWKATEAAVSVGDVANGKTRQITSVAAGTEDTDAVNVAQLKRVNGQVIQNAQNITNLYDSVDKLGNRINRVGAGAAALAALHPLDFDPDDKWDFAVGYGNYRGANAAAVGAYYRPNEDTMFSVGGSMGGGENMVNVGFSVKLGRGTNNVTTSKVAMAKELKELRSTVVTQAAQIAALTAMVNQLIENTNAQPLESQYIAPGVERYKIVNIERDEEVDGLLPIERVRAIETEEAQAASPADVTE